MSSGWHKVFIGTFIAIGFTTLVILSYWGYSYYATPLTERPFHDDHRLLKSSGPFGHGFGIVGTLMILIGVTTYIARKKRKFLPNFGALKYWLEFHIFLCSVGPLLILFHTAFKFGGIVSVSFWSMVAVVLSGVIGRFIYIQIPRTIQGRELSLGEIREMKENMHSQLTGKYNLSEAASGQLAALINRPDAISGRNPVRQLWDSLWAARANRSSIVSILRSSGLSGQERRQVLGLVKRELVLAQRIQRLQTMQQLFKYWHVAHLPFALVMLIIMVIHVIITLAFGYRWIF